ncbi:MAG: hypothetical protein HOK28_20665 [Deltaproteobacteria bacterium]|nr:hypothetical protein [Deltaproteobacteria bacterium]
MQPLGNKFITIFICALLCGCAELGSNSQESLNDPSGLATSCPQKDRSWTFLFYIVADDGGSSFDASTTRYLNTMPPLPNNVEALVLVDRCSAPLWPISTTTGPVLDSCAQLYQIQRDGSPQLLDTAPYKLSWLQGFEGDLNMGSYETLSQFVLFGLKHTSTTNYGLMIAGHGDGDQVGFDSTNDSSLNHAELEFAFEKALTTLANPCLPKLDLVIMAACAMATTGMYTALAPYARWLIASQENIYGYNLSWMENLGSKEPSGYISKAEVAQALKNGRVEGENGLGQQVTMMLSEEVAQELAALARETGAVLMETDVPRSALEDASFNPKTYDFRLIAEKIQDDVLLSQVDDLMEQTIYEQTELSEGMNGSIEAHGISVTTSDLGLPGSLVF